MKQLIIDKALFVKDPEYYENLILNFYKDYGENITSVNVHNMIINWGTFYSVTMLNEKIVCLCRFANVYARKTIFMARQIDTLPEFRGKGIGSKTISFAESYLKQIGARRLISAVDSDNIASIKMHQKCGFKISTPPVYIKNDKNRFWEGAIYFEKDFTKNKVKYIDNHIIKSELKEF